MSYQKPRTRLFALLAAAALLPLAAIPSNAQSARQLLSGSTTLALDSGLVTGLTDSGVVVSSIKLRSRMLTQPRLQVLPQAARTRHVTILNRFLGR